MQMSLSQGMFSLTGMEGSGTEPWKELNSLMFLHSSSCRHLTSVLNTASSNGNCLSG